MKDKNIERVLLYLLCFILIMVIYALIGHLILSETNFSLDPGSWDSISNFLGSLIGALLSGAIAIFIMFRQNYENIKETNVSRYGSMKFIAIKLSFFSEYCNLIEFVIENVNKMENKSNINEIFKLMPLAQLEGTRGLLEKEREKIPYEFITRYLSVMNTFDYIIASLESYIKSPNQKSEQFLKSQIDNGKDVIYRFTDNAFKYTFEVEKKFNFKDAY